MNTPTCTKCTKGSLAKILQFGNIPSSIGFVKCPSCKEIFVMYKNSSLQKVEIYCLGDEFKSADRRPIEI